MSLLSPDTDPHQLVYALRRRLVNHSVDAETTSMFDTLMDLQEELEDDEGEVGSIQDEINRIRVLYNVIRIIHMRHRTYIMNPTEINREVLKQSLDRYRCITGHSKTYKDASFSFPTKPESN